ERMIAVGGSRAIVTVLGLLLIVAAIALRARRAAAASDERKSVEKMLLGLAGVGLFALVVYFAQSDVVTRAFGKSLEAKAPRVAVALAVLWPAIWVASIVPTVMVEVAYAAVARAPRLELRRIRDALYTGLGLSGVLVFAFTMVYVGSERDKKVDLSYFKTSKPGTATQNTLNALTEPIQIAMFFPPANEVGEQASSYFEELKRLSPHVQLAHYDQAVDVAKAKELGASG